MKKLVPIIMCLWLIPVAGILAAGRNEQGNAAAPGKKITGEITFLNQRTDFMTTLWPKIAEDFGKKYPGIELTIDAQTDLDRLMKIRMSANDVPDVWTVFPSVYTSEQLVQANLALNDMDFAKDFIEIDARQFTAADGKLYAAPQGRSLGGIVVYNRKIFADLGIAVPATLDELIAAGKKIAASGKTALGTSAKAQWPLFPYEVYAPMYYSGDEDILNGMSASDEPFTKDGPFAKSYELLLKLKDAGILEKDPLSKDWEPFKKDFQAGNVAMFFIDGWFVPQATVEGGAVKPEDIGVFAMPFDDNPAARYACYKLDSGLGVSKKSKSPEAAQAFISYMMNDAYETYARAAGIFSSRKSIVVEYEYAKSLRITKEMTQPGRTALTSEIISRGQIDFSRKFQEILAGAGVKEVLADLNKGWKKGRTGN